MGRQVELSMASTAAQAQHVRNGKLRRCAHRRQALAYHARCATLTEQGIKLSAHACGILAPAGTPRRSSTDSFLS